MERMCNRGCARPHCGHPALAAPQAAFNRRCAAGISSLRAALVLALALAAPAGAQELFRCVNAEKKVTYQQSPCPQASAAHKIDARPANPTVDHSQRASLLQQGRAADKRIEARAALEAKEAQARDDAQRRAEERQAARDRQAFEQEMLRMLARQRDALAHEQEALRQVVEARNRNEALTDPRWSDGRTYLGNAGANCVVSGMHVTCR